MNDDSTNNKEKEHFQPGDLICLAEPDFYRVDYRRYDYSGNAAVIRNNAFQMQHHNTDFFIFLDIVVVIANKVCLKAYSLKQEKVVEVLLSNYRISRKQAWKVIFSYFKKA